MVMFQSFSGGECGVMYRGFNTKISASTGILAVLLVSFLLILNLNLTIAIAEPSRVVTLYVGFKAVDRYIYEDVIVDVVYLNPRIYYTYRNSYVVPSKDFYIPPDQSIGRALDSIIEQLRSIGVEAKLITRYVAVGMTRDLSSRVVIIGLLDEHSAKYTIRSGSSRITTDKIDPSDYFIVMSISRTYIVMDYTSLPSSEREKLVTIIRSFFEGLNKTILIYDSKAFEVEEAYHTDLYEYTNLSDIVGNAMSKARDSSFKASNYSCFSFVGGKLGGYWLTLGITKSYSDCRDEVEKFVRVYVDEIRKVIPDDKPIYIELVENAPTLKIPISSPETPTTIMIPVIAIGVTALIATLLLREKFLNKVKRI
jgi:hypothetical protein